MNSRSGHDFGYTGGPKEDPHAQHDLPLARYFAALPDPRADRTKKHALLDIRVIALCATIAGTDSWDEVQRFGEARVDWLRRCLALPNGIPSYDSFKRVLARIDPKAFARCVADWMAAACEAIGLRHVAVDGKSVRSAPPRNLLRLPPLGQRVGGREPADPRTGGRGRRLARDRRRPELLRALDLKGALANLDAAGCQTAIAGQIRATDGHYLLAVKGDQSTLHGEFGRACEANFAGSEHDVHEQVEDGHGRHEERHTTALYDPTGLLTGWPDVAAAVLVGRVRSIRGVNASTAHDYITNPRGTAAELGRLIRRHWSVENELHWVLDVAFREDDNRTAAGHAGANLGLIRRVAASLLMQNPGKGSIKAKRLHAAWVGDYLEQILRGFQPN